MRVRRSAVEVAEDIRQGSKTCNICGSHKIFSEYHKQKEMPDGRRGMCIICFNERSVRSKDSYRRTQRDLRYRRLYKITLEEYETMFEEQGGSCAICGNPSGVSLAVDHDHITGKVRGLLCWSCNSAIGLLGDTAESVMKAVRYLEVSH